MRDSARVPGQVMRIARRLLGLPLVNIGGTDLVGGAHKLLLAILWQLMRFHTRALLQSVAPPGARARRPLGAAGQSCGACLVPQARVVRRAGSRSRRLRSGIL